MKFFRLACASVAVCLIAIKTYGDIVYVWSYDGTIRRFDSNGAGSVFATNNLSGWNGPVGLALDNLGNLYAGVPSQSFIYKFAPSGARSLIGYIDSISGLTFDKMGCLYATTPNYVEIGKCAYELVYFPGYFDLVPWTQAHLDYPVNLAFDSAGTIYVSSSVWASTFPPPGLKATTIETYSTNFTYLGPFATDLNEPYGLAFDGSGNLYVANSGITGALVNTIVKLTPAGVPSTFASATNGLSQPAGLAFDSVGNLFVANHGNGTIVKLTPDGTGSVFASGLISPASIAIFPGLNLWSATPITVSNPKALTNGMFQFELRENPGLDLTVLGTTDVSLPLTNWAALGSTMEVSPGRYQFLDPQATNSSQRFYRVRSP